MTRDELAARLFVEWVAIPNEIANDAALTRADKKALAKTAGKCFDLADAFEAERKRRLTEPDGES